DVAALVNGHVIGDILPDVAVDVLPPVALQARGRGALGLGADGAGGAGVVQGDADDGSGARGRRVALGGGPSGPGHDLRLLLGHGGPLVNGPALGAPVLCHVNVIPAVMTAVPTARTSPTTTCRMVRPSSSCCRSSSSTRACSASCRAVYSSAVSRLSMRFSICWCRYRTTASGSPCGSPCIRAWSSGFIRSPRARGCSRPRR